MSDLLLNPTESSNPMQKLVRAGQYVSKYTNWIECCRLRMAVGKPTGEMAVVHCRNGMQMQVRVGTPDIAVVSEVLLIGAYASAEKLIAAIKGPSSIVDLGGNIGSFGLRCAFASPDAYVHCYEPGPQNASVLQKEY